VRDFEALMLVLQRGDDAALVSARADLLITMSQMWSRLADSEEQLLQCVDAMRAAADSLDGARVALWKSDRRAHRSVVSVQDDLRLCISESEECLGIEDVEDEP